MEEFGLWFRIVTEQICTPILLCWEQAYLETLLWFMKSLNGCFTL
jgi:hypothetical protein